MPFHDLTELIGPAARKYTSSISIQSRGIVIRPARELLTQLGWVLGDKIRPLAGYGEDEGMVLLEKSDRLGWVLSVGGGKSKPGHNTTPVLKLPLRLAGKPSLPGMPEILPPTQINLVIDGNALRFVLPWFPTERFLGLAPLRGPLEPEPAPAKSVPESLVNPTLQWATRIDRAGPPTPRAESKDVGGRPSDLWAPLIVLQAQTLRSAGKTHSEIAKLLSQQTGRQYTKSAVIGKMAREASPPGSITNDPATWDPAVRERFIQGVLDNKLRSELAVICGRAAGSISDIINRYLDAEITKRRKAARRMSKADVPANGHAPAPTGPRQVDPRLLEFFREEVQPMLTPMGYLVRKSKDGTKLTFNDVEMAVQVIIDRANDALDLDETERFVLPPELAEVVERMEGSNA